MATFGTGWYLGQRDIATVHAQTTMNIPKAWGSLKAALGTVYVLEAPDGTIRAVNYENGTVVCIARRN